MPNAIVAVTPGDAAGVGPEILAKAISGLPRDRGFALVIVGDARVVARGIEVAQTPVSMEPVRRTQIGNLASSQVYLLDTHNMPHRVPWGQLDARCGRAMVEDIRLACTLAQEGRVQAVVGGPHSKKAAQLAGLDFQGYPHFLQDLMGVERIYFMLVLDGFRVTAVTHHMALREVSTHITTENVLHAVQALWQAVRQSGVAHPRLVVSGLNPHSGEGGTFGDEEILAIGPAIELARRQGLEVEGPLPADSLFFGIPEHVQWDGYLVMYHDQSHLPIKTVAFDRGCAQIIGTSIPFTTVIHGVAFDIAGRGVARHRSMMEAISLAARCAQTHCGATWKGPTAT
jgi:4-hydroxythreonine-4-phosphate dehydrogenase